MRFRLSHRISRRLGSPPGIAGSGRDAVVRSSHSGKSTGLGFPSISLSYYRRHIPTPLVDNDDDEFKLGAKPARNKNLWHATPLVEYWAIYIAVEMTLSYASIVGPEWH